MEQKFFKNGNTYILGEKITCIDYVFYHELLTAMILSGNGTKSEFLSSDTEMRSEKLQYLTQWYRMMSNDRFVKSVADRFIDEMQKKSSGQETPGGSFSSDHDQHGRKKSVKFAMDRKVGFKEENEEHR